MYFHKTPFWVKRIFSAYTWDIPESEKVLYLTFDDGPVPEVTTFVLEQLSQFNAEATFFCVGDNIRKHPEVFQMILQNGHAVGNHTFNHLNGWKTPVEEYLDNIDRCANEMVKNSPNSNFSLLRPPHGRITRKQAGQLRRKGYQIIMWDVLSGDFDVHLDSKKCFEKSIQGTKEGTIIIFHDSLKAERNLRYVLPRYLDYFSSKGFIFKKLPESF
ncbi:polysaccharide deacetylase family protein [Xanthovirga aplysinae]|uniref:polysaccharide deacetylase family protein n=1 Tax=Xanthovirga aplysinae TaxID=2529853 RepID=UPI0012BC8A72|nr:polysaccharide deacetylase family protein [Xanthovirga aplysinae]MTI32785.1 polysaccharide deacetylase family protein [Xanthovirga aplysinae]